MKKCLIKWNLQRRLPESVNVLLFHVIRILQSFQLNTSFRECNIYWLLRYWALHITYLLSSSPLSFELSGVFTYFAEAEVEIWRCYADLTIVKQLRSDQTLRFKPRFVLVQMYAFSVMPVFPEHIGRDIAFHSQE